MAPFMLKEKTSQNSAAQLPQHSAFRTLSFSLECHRCGLEVAVMLLIPLLRIRKGQTNSNQRYSKKAQQYI